MTASQRLSQFDHERPCFQKPSIDSVLKSAGLPESHFALAHQIAAKLTNYSLLILGELFLLTLSYSGILSA